MLHNCGLLLSKTESSVIVFHYKNKFYSSKLILCVWFLKLKSKKQNYPQNKMKYRKKSKEKSNILE